MPGAHIYYFYCITQTEEESVDEAAKDAKLEQEVSDEIFEHLNQHEAWVVEHPTSVDPDAPPAELHVIWHPEGLDGDPVCIAVTFQRIL